MRESVVEKWEKDMDNALELGLIVAGLPEDYYEDEENEHNALHEAIAEFARQHKYSEKTEEELLDCIPVWAAFFNMLHENGLKREVEE